jgi:hypothetical protein
VFLLILLRGLVGLNRDGGKWNEILKGAEIFFGVELDRQQKM